MRVVSIQRATPLALFALALLVLVSCRTPAPSQAASIATASPRPAATETALPTVSRLIQPEPVDTPRPVSTAPAPPTQVGIQVHGCGAQPPEEMVELAARAGFAWVKQQVRWDEIEGVRGAYAWKCIDDVVNQADAHGLKMLLSVTTAPRWARTWTQGEAGPPDADLFAGFLTEMVQRYARKIHAVEIFNEPNLAAEWGDSLSPGYYAQMLIAASQAIRRADPRIMIISAGLAPTRWNDWGTAIDDLEYLRRMGASAAYYADCIGAHTNDGTASPLSPDSPLPHLVAGYRELTGYSKPLCLTEFGIATPVHGRTPRGFQWAAHTTPERQAQWLVDGVRWASAHPDAVRLLIVWNLNYFSDDSDPNSLYSLWTPQGMRPAYDALKAVLR